MLEIKSVGEQRINSKAPEHLPSAFSMWCVVSHILCAPGSSSWETVGNTLSFPVPDGFA
jgi:hypothetical protein